MSFQAVEWALDAEKTGPLAAETRLVLVVMAERADRHGRNVYLAAATIAERLGMSERAVRRHFSTLRQRSLILPGDPEQIPEKIPHNRRPVIYDLPIKKRPTPATSVTPAEEPPAWLDGHDEDTEWASMEALCPDSNVIPIRRPGVTPVALRGDTCGHSGVTAVSANKVSNPPKIRMNSPHHVLSSWVGRMIGALDLTNLRDDMDAATRWRFA